MVTFRRTPNPRNYFSRREQRRLLLLVLTLGLVIFLIAEGGNFAERFCGGENTPPAASPSVEVTEIDNRLEPPPKKIDEIPGAFTSPAPVKDDVPEDTTGRYFPGVKPAYLKEVRDNTRPRKKERKALFNLLDILNKTDEKTLERESTGRATYAQLVSQSNAYRGELVTVGGKIHRTELLRNIPKNDCGITQYYRTVVKPADNPLSPLLVYCLELPEGFPQGMEINEKVEITGFYFKREPYIDQKKQLRTAPTLLAKTVHWYKRPPRKSIDIVTVLVVIAVAAVASLLVAAHVYFRTRTVRPAESDAPPELDVLRDFDTTSGAGPLPQSVDNPDNPEQQE